MRITVDVIDPRIADDDAAPVIAEAIGEERIVHIKAALRIRGIHEGVVILKVCACLHIDFEFAVRTRANGCRSRHLPTIRGPLVLLLGEDPAFRSKLCLELPLEFVLPCFHLLLESRLTRLHGRLRIQLPYSVLNGLRIVSLVVRLLPETATAEFACTEVV